MVVTPKSGKHTRCLVILHGRGSNGEKFGLELLQTHIPGYETLQDALPDAKFIFPTAAKRRARIFNRTPMHQWLDNWSLQTPAEREEFLFNGLRESTIFIHGLLEAEIAAVGAEHVLLWGLSQGCAASLVASLLWQGEGYAAVIGMCGWLPLRKQIEDAVFQTEVDGKADDPFGQDDEDSAGHTVPDINMVVEYLREEIQMPSDLSSSKLSDMPVFLGHGTEDEKVPLALGREAAELLRKLDVGAESKEYEGLGHWYSGEMLCDIVNFIQRQAEWPMKPASSDKQGRLQV